MLILVFGLGGTVGDNAFKLDFTMMFAMLDAIDAALADRDYGPKVLGERVRGLADGLRAHLALSAVDA